MRGQSGGESLEWWGLIQQCPCKLGWGPTAQALVGPHGVVLNAPPLDLARCVGEHHEPVGIPTLVAQLAIEALDAGGLNRPTPSRIYWGTAPRSRAQR